jgi:predicted Zn finger-like uncharacterized protein
MRIACPGCAATYEVPASRLKPNKQVRCARCGNSWLPEIATETDPDAQADAQADLPDPRVADEQPAEPTRPAPQMTAMDRLAVTAQPSPPRAGLIGAWVATAIVLAGAVTAAIVWRDAVVHAWPPGGRILPATGQPPAPATPQAAAAAHTPPPARTTQAPPPAQTADKKAE